MFKQQSGFTLIELVVVIVILGILAAVALPRFISITTDARIAKMNGVAGAMSSAGSLAHAALLVAQLASSASISMEGQTVSMSNGYPDTTATGIPVAANLSATDYNLIGGNPYEVSSDTGHASCKVRYTPATTTGPPVVDRTTFLTAGNCT